MNTVFTNLPQEKFDIVLIDPPWSYTGQQNKWGAAAKFYQTLSDDELMNFPIYNLLEKNSIVFMWATCPRLDSAINLGKSWGLYFRGVPFVWVKTKADGTPIGAQGVRPSIVKPLTEMVLAFSTVKEGRPLKLFNEAIQQTVFAPRQEHSQKPEEVQTRIELMYPETKKIEIFARRERPGWICWGNEI